jgi:hypothetical protein
VVSSGYHSISTAAMRGAMRVLLLVAVTLAYDFNDPDAPHTSMAIRFDGEGRRADSRRAFEAAARFTPTTSTLVNLGVCYMRMASASAHRARKVELYGLSRDAMKRGGELVQDEEDQKLYGENWGHLMTNFEIEHVPFDQEEVLEADPQMCGAPPPVSDDSWLQRNDGSDRDGLLLHRVPVEPGMELPRIHVRDLDQYEHFLERRDPFILLGAADWPIIENAKDGWSWLEELARRWPKAVTDFYPHNMLSHSRQSPYLTRLATAVEELKVDPRTQESKFRYETQGGALEGRYMHLQLTPAQWLELEKSDIPVERHVHLENDNWLRKCLGYPHEAVAAEYHLKTHWKILLVGARGAGMFNHSDSLQTSSWHLTVTGRKWWYVCGTLSNETSSKCFEGVVQPGEVLYYGRGWSHETQNVDAPTITLTDTAVHQRNYQAMADKLYGECTREVLDFKFSGALCDALDTCYGALYELFGGDEPYSIYRPWREVASQELIEKRDAISPEENNYDGRNYITE